MRFMACRFGSVPRLDSEQRTTRHSWSMRAGIQFTAPSHESSSRTVVFLTSWTNRSHEASFHVALIKTAALLSKEMHKLIDEHWIELSRRVQLHHFRGNTLAGVKPEALSCEVLIAAYRDAYPRCSGTNTSIRKRTRSGGSRARLPLKC